MENLKRPVKSETDDDLLKQQKRFLKEQKRPSVQLVPNKSKTVKFSQQDNPEDIHKANESKDEAVHPELETVSGGIISDVKERDVIFSEPFVFQPPRIDPPEFNHTFSKSVKVSKFAAQRKSQSIFAEMQNSSKNGDVSEKLKVIDTPALIDGSGLAPDEKHSEARKIHEENVAKLSTMSEEEILHEQEQLKNLLKPELLSFIKSRKGVKKSQASSNRMFQRDVNRSENENLPGEILRKEGNKERDALILEKVLDVENERGVPENQNVGVSRKAEDTNEFEIPVEVKDLVEGNDKGLWRNMNKIENEKLEWMTDLPQPKPVDLKTGYTARFDFEGKLLARAADIPTYQGLHHHGDEPEVPGYSLEELFLLARSSLQSQRITALHTLAHILENNWYGMMDVCFEAPLLPQLLNAGIVPLLRWALDDTSLTSVSATITAIHSLLISKADEACLHKTFCWLNGHIVPQLEPQDLDEPNIIMEELTDADLIKLDVVKGFLRIDILPRFMYILKVICPPPLVCKLVIEICARLAQHSPESALQVAEQPGFLTILFEKFLPLSWKLVDSSSLTDTVSYSFPMHSALKLMRIIASSCRAMAICLVENYDLTSIITFYLTIQPIDEKLSAQEVQLLVIETLKIWHTYLCYGLGFSVFLNIFPIFLRQLDYCLSLNLNCETKKYIKDLDYASHLFKAFEAVAAYAPEQKDNASSTAVNVIFKKALVCLKKWIWQFSQEKSSTEQMTLLASCMNFIVTYCKKSHEGLTCEDFEPCSAVKEVFEKFLVPAMKSSHFLNLLQEFRSYSLLLCSEINGNKRDGKTIVSLGSILYGEDILPNLKDGTPLPLLSSIMNYIILYKSFFHASTNEGIEIVFCSPVTEYLKAISCKVLKSSCWFLQFETFYVYQLVHLSTYVSIESLKSHEIAISVLPLFTPSEECLVEDLFENIIFNQDQILKMSSLLTSINSYKEAELQSITSRLPVIAPYYISCFLNEEAIKNSRSILNRNTDLDSLFRLSTPSVLINQDWCFKPISDLYQKSKQKKGGECVSPEESLQILCGLQWNYLCHILSLPVLKDVPASVEFYYLCMVFLLDEDLFRDDKIKALLANCMAIILRQKKLNLSKLKWNGLNNFDNLYLELLVQYEAVSYGDEMFGRFLVLPLQQHCPSHWKILLFTEHSPVLSFLRVPLAKMLVPLEHFLEPIEADVELLSQYFKALASGSLSHIRCPLLYLMAVHHIHNFIFIKSDIHVKSQKVLLSSILRSKKDLQRKILLYLRLEETSEYGFCMTEKLSSENAAHLSDIMGVPVTI